MTTILIIDDDIQVLATLRKMLEREGYEVATASDGKEGVRCYRESPADLIITDLVMPEKDGVDTILELRRDFPEVQIIAISGGGTIDSNQYLCIAKQAGAQYVFPKPVERETFLNAVRELLN